jgi:signal transduction histidine kinase
MLERNKEVTAMPTETMIPPAFIGMMPGSPLTDPPADEKSPIEKLFAQLEAHEREEEETLKDYEAAAKAAPDAGFRYLMGLVLEDEERHHRLSKAMADEVGQSLLWLQREEPLPSIRPTPEEAQKLLRQTERFLKIEQDGERQLADMRHQVKDLHAGLLELIVDMMRADTEKHVHILKYIKKRLEER